MIFNKLFYKKNSNICKTSKIYPFSRITNSNIGSHSYVSYFSQINNSKIGNYCSIAKRFNAGLGFHPTDFISTSPVFYSPKNPLFKSIVKDKMFNDSKSISIGSDVWIGCNVTLVDGVNIGHGSIIGAHSLVINDVEPYSIVGGVPAKLIRKRFTDEEIEYLLKLKWWDKSLEFFDTPQFIKLFSEKSSINRLRQLEKIINKKK